MDTVETLRRAIEQVFASWEQLPRIPSNWKIVGVMDKEHDRYVLMHEDMDDGKFRSHTLAHLEIQDGKIWILTDNTEEGIATELVAMGVPKDRIVLGFYPPSVREMGEFAVA